MKLYTKIILGHLREKNYQEIITTSTLVHSCIPSFLSSGHIEVQERASSAIVLIELIKTDLKESLYILTSDEDDVQIPAHVVELIQEMEQLYSGDLNPVAPKAQRKVILPEGLNLDEWINTPPSESSVSSEDEKCDLFISVAEYNNKNSEKTTTTVEPSKEDLDKIRTARKIEQNNNPNYLKSSSTKSGANSNSTLSTNESCENIPIAKLNLDVPSLQIHCECFYCLSFSEFNGRISLECNKRVCSGDCGFPFH